jgi:hypothetical protein
VNLAVGFRGHVAVTVGGDLTVIDRREIRVRDGQPYHLARTRPIADAQKIVDCAHNEAKKRMRDGLRQLANDVEPHTIGALGLILGSFRLPSKLEDLLASHAACHAAEGEISREAVFALSEELKLPLTAVRDHEITITEEIERLGKDIGPPWRKDHKLAAAVAWLAAAVIGGRDGR